LLSHLYVGFATLVETARPQRRLAGEPTASCWDSNS